MALPTLTETIDDDFVNTWYEIRPKVIDQVLESNVLSLALKEFGCMTPQVGGEFITRTVGYGQKSTQRFEKGTVLTQEVIPLDTMGIWQWRYFLVDINRTLIDDNKNAGKFKIKDYLTRRIEAAKDAIETDWESGLFRWGVYYDGIATFNGLYDVCPNITAEDAVGDGTASGTYATGTSNGGISRTNTWWRNYAAADSQTENKANRLLDLNVPYNLNLVPDMRHVFNTVTNKNRSPNFIIMDQLIYEAYEDEVGDKQSIVRTGFSSKAADLGFDTLTFKGAPMTFSSKLASTGHIFMLNLNDIEVVYNPNMWFDMTNWKETANQLERVAYIANMTTGMLTEQPRSHAVMEYSS